MRRLAAIALVLAACGTAAVTSPTVSPTTTASRTPVPVASVASGPAPSLSFASMDCAAAGSAEFDFWVGTWDVTWTTSAGAEAKGTNTVTKQGCVVVEHFDGPLGGVQGYIGNSAAAWVPSLGKWQQNYIDTTGFSGVYVGGREGDAFILYRATAGGTIANTGRLVWKDITADSSCGRTTPRAITARRGRSASASSTRAGANGDRARRGASAATPPRGARS